MGQNTELGLIQCSVSFELASNHCMQISCQGFLYPRGSCKQFAGSDAVLFRVASVYSPGIFHAVQFDAVPCYESPANRASLSMDFYRLCHEDFLHEDKILLRWSAFLAYGLRV